MSWLSDIWHGFIDWLIPGQDAQGSYITKTGTNQYIPVVYGEQRVSGITIFKRSSDRSGGPWNDYLHLIIVLCEGEIQAIDEVFFNGISQNDSRWGSEWYHIEKFLGSDAQAACTTLINHNVGWTSTDKLSGLAYLYVRLRQNKDLNKWQGEPEVSVRLRGKKVKNLETLVTEYSTVPAYCLNDYLTRPRYGKGASEVLIDQASFIASAAFTSASVGATEDQVIDEIRTIGDVFPGWGSIDWSTGADKWDDLLLPGLFNQTTNSQAVSQPLMSCNVTLDTSKTLFENTKILLSGIRGMVPDTTGVIKLIHETSGSPVFAFDETNIIGGIKLEIKGRKEKANQVTVSFKNKALNFEDDNVVFPETDSALHVQWLTEDYNVDLPDEIAMPTINNKAEALQMCEVIARLSRNFFQITFTADLSSVNVEPTDIVSVTDDFYGFVDKPFRIISLNPKNNGNTFVAIEHQDTVYPWVDRTYLQDYPKTSFGNPFDLFPPTGATHYIGDGFVKVSWYASPDKNIKGYAVDLYNATTDDLISSITVTDNFIFYQDLNSGSYTVKVYAVSTLGVSISSETSFTLTSLLIWLKPQTDGSDSMKLVLKDDRVSSFIDAIQFYYSDADYGGTPNISLAINGGVGDSLIIPSPLPGVVYYVWYSNGLAPWYKVRVTLDPVYTPTELTTILLPDVIDQVQDELQIVVDETLVSYSNTEEVTALIDQYLEAGEDPRISIIEQVNSIFDTQERKAETKLVNVALVTETETRAAQYSILNSNDEVFLTRIDLAETNIEGNATAVSSVTGLVTNPTTGLSATFTLAGLAKTTADGAASSATVIQNQVDNPTNGLSATFTLAGLAKTTADGAASSIASVSTTANSAYNTANAGLTLASLIDDSLDLYRATAQLKVEATGRVGFIQLDATPTVSQIKFKADEIFFLNSADTPVVYWNTSLGKYVFVGEIQATSGTFTGLVTGAQGLFTDGLSVDYNNTKLVVGRNIVGGATDFIELSTVDASITMSENSVNIGGIDSTLNITSNIVTFNDSKVTHTYLGSGYGFDIETGGGSSGVSITGDLLVTGTFTNFTGGHPANSVQSKPDVGDIVIDVDVKIIDTFNAVGNYEKSTTAYDKKIIGVYGYFREADNKDILLAVGEGTINVCGQNGDIEIGDLIVTSDIAGKGMRQDDDLVRNCTVAKSRQSVIFSSQDEIKQIACIYMCG